MRRFANTSKPRDERVVKYGGVAFHIRAHCLACSEFRGFDIVRETTQALCQYWITPIKQSMEHAVDNARVKHSVVEFTVCVGFDECFHGLLDKRAASEKAGGALLEAMAACLPNTSGCGGVLALTTEDDGVPCLRSRRKIRAAVAHELGHLLGIQEHSRNYSSIMSRWGGIGAGELALTADVAEVIRGLWVTGVEDLT